MIGVQKLLGVAGGFSAGYYALSECLLNHSKTTQVTQHEYDNNPRLRNLILKRHNTMKTVLNVDMSHASRSHNKK